MRECGTCTKCCEGHLHGSAHGHAFWKGRPCHFLSASKGCTIYTDRPENPCKTYKCMWLADETNKIPEWLKPNEVNAILTLRQVNGIEYIHLAEAGETMRSDVLSWAIQHTLNNGLNLSYEVDGGFNKIGQDDFIKENI